MTSHRYKVALHRLQVNFPDHLSAPDIIPSFTPFVCEEDGDVLFTMDVEEGTAPDFSGWREIGQFDCGGANHGVYLAADGSYAFEISLPACDGGLLSCCLVAHDDFRRCRAVLTGSSVRRTGASFSLLQETASRPMTARALKINFFMFIPRLRHTLGPRVERIGIIEVLAGRSARGDLRHEEILLETDIGDADVGSQILFLHFAYMIMIYSFAAPFALRTAHIRCKLRQKKQIIQTIPLRSARALDFWKIRPNFATLYLSLKKIK